MENENRIYPPHFDWSFYKIWEGSTKRGHRKICPAHTSQGILRCTCDNPTGDTLAYDMACIKTRNNPIYNAQKKFTFRHIFITISLPTNIDITLMKEFDPDLMNLNPLECLWCLEFYGKDLQYHPHIHLLMKTQKKLDRKRIIDKLSKMFDVAPNFIDYKFGSTKLMYNKRLAYIQGDKTETKSAQLIKDEKFRVENNIKSHYKL